MGLFSGTAGSEPVTLGKKYRDTISGFEGTATARTEYLYGCVRVILEAEGTKQDDREQFFDEQRLVALDGRKPKPTATAGGPRTEAQRQRDPVR